ncbi:hypothetical protein [Sporomusa aerivorans]
MRGDIVKNKDEIMLEFYRANVETEKDPVKRASYKKLIAKYERKMGKAG